MHSTTDGGRLRKLITNPAWIAFVWFGVTAGVALIATPARFAAQTITRPVALDVGRMVFTALNRSELVLLILLLLAVRVSGSARRYWVPAGLVTLVLLAQSVWLLPELAARAQQIVAGSEPPPSYAHAAYSTLELVKLGLLLALGFMGLADLAGRGDTPAK